MKASENKYLKVASGVVLNELIEEVICLLDPWFEQFQRTAIVTSGVRTAEKQLQIIKEKALRHKLFGKEFLDPITLDDSDLICEVWSKVLEAGDIVNPPYMMMNKYPYKRNGVTMNAGRKIGLSPHQKGTAFDIGGGDSLQARIIVVDAALADKSIEGLKGYLPEPVNNAVHVDCDAAYKKFDSSL